MKQVSAILATALLLCGALGAQAAVELVSPAEGEVVPLLTEPQKAYVKLPLAERRVLFSDEEFRRKKMGLPTVKKRRADWPKAVELVWKAKPGVASRVTVRDVAKGSVVFEASVSNTTASVDNLEIAAAYEWTVDDGEGAAKRIFRTEDLAPRLVRFPGVGNVRDLGGWKGLDGRRIRQGLVFRSAGLNQNASTKSKEKKDWVPGKILVAGEKGEYIRSRFGIKTDIDLRWAKECYGMTGSPLGPTVAWHMYPSWPYGGVTCKQGSAAFKQVFTLFLDEKNYPIVFHCIAGQDRTGTDAYVLEALLGVDEDTLALDWELSGLNNRSAGFNHKERYDGLVAAVNKNFPAPTVRERAEKFVLSLGFTEADLEKFRSIMLEPKGGPR